MLGPVRQRRLESQQVIDRALGLALVALLALAGCVSAPVEQLQEPMPQAYYLPHAEERVWAEVLRVTQLESPDVVLVVDERYRLVSWSDRKRTSTVVTTIRVRESGPGARITVRRTSFWASSEEEDGVTFDLGLFGRDFVASVTERLP